MPENILNRFKMQESGDDFLRFLLHNRRKSSIFAPELQLSAAFAGEFFHDPPRQGAGFVLRISRLKLRTNLTDYLFHGAKLQKNNEIRKFLLMNYEQYIARCIEIARRGEYYVAPNPMVGAVLVVGRIDEYSVLVEIAHGRTLLNGTFTFSAVRIR